MATPPVAGQAISFADGLPPAVIEMMLGRVPAVDVIAREDTLLIRRMWDERDDYALMVRWRNAPHVREWWRVGAINFGWPPAAPIDGAVLKPTNPFVRVIGRDDRLRSGPRSPAG